MTPLREMSPIRETIDGAWDKPQEKFWVRDRGSKSRRTRCFSRAVVTHCQRQELNCHCWEREAAVGERFIKDHDIKKVRNKSERCLFETALTV